MRQPFTRNQITEKLTAIGHHIVSYKRPGKGLKLQMKNNSNEKLLIYF